MNNMHELMIKKINNQLI